MKFQKIMSQACTVLSDFDFSSDDSSSSEEDEKVKCKQDDFTDLCLMGKSSRNISDFDSDVSEDLSSEGFSLTPSHIQKAHPLQQIIGNLNERLTRSSRSTHLSCFTNTLFVP
jgi:hypothetical protein